MNTVVVQYENYIQIKNKICSVSSFALVSQLQSISHRHNGSSLCLFRGDLSFLSLPLPSIYFMTLSILLDFQIGFILCLSNLLNESVNSILIVSYLTSLTCESISRFISFNSTTIFKKINVARIRYRLSFEKLFFYCRFKCFVSLFQSQ